jgi:hypothetical protein
VGGQLSRGDVGEGHALEHAAQARPHGDPHVAQRLGRTRVAQVLRGGAR